MNLTPEQMNAAVEAAARAVYNIEEYVDEGPAWTDDHLPSNEWQEEAVVIATAAITRALPVLFAAWQEQTAAKAGEVGAPVEDAPGESILRESCVWFEDYDDRNYGPMVTLPDARRAIVAGAAAGVAASEARVREALSDPPYPLPARDDIERARLIGWQDACFALAALLSEEPADG